MAIEKLPELPTDIEDEAASLRMAAENRAKLNELIELVTTDREMLIKERVGEVIFQMARAEAEQGLLKMPLVFVHGRAHGQEIVEFLVEHELVDFVDGDGLQLTESGRAQGLMMMNIAETEADRAVDGM